MDHPSSERGEYGLFYWRKKKEKKRKKIGNIIAE